MIKSLFSIFLIIVSFKVNALNIATYNIRNFEMNRPYSTDQRVLSSILKEVNADIFSFQEIVDTKNFKKLTKRIFPNHKLFLSNCGGFAKQKLALLYNAKKYRFIKAIEDSSFQKEADCNRGVRPLLKIKLKKLSDQSTFWTLLVHLKAGGNDSDVQFRKKQIKLLEKSISRIKNFIILGDFNTTEFGNSRGDYFQNFIYKSKLTDSSKSLKCTSYWSGGISDGLFYPGTLDHILLSKSLKKKYSTYNFTVHSHCRVNKCTISSSRELGDSFNNVSDHCPVKLELTKG